MSHDAKVKALARGPEHLHYCPSCGRTVAVVYGYVTQHTDPKTWKTKPAQCARAFTKFEPKPVTGFFATLSPAQLERAMAYTGEDNHGSDEFRRTAA